MDINNQTLSKNPKYNKKKRKEREDSSSESERIPEQTPDVWPRFLVVSPVDEEKPLTKVSPFAIHKTIVSVAGQPVSDIKRQRSGELLIQVAKKSHANNLLTLSHILNIPVKVTPHKTLNSVKGVIREYDLLHCDEKEIFEELSEQGVTCVKRIAVKREGVLRNTVTVILTFGLSVLPSHVICGYLRVPVEQYIPNPLRCFKCQRFGHHINTCKKTKVCARCGKSDHDDRTCEASACCVNCKGGHSAFSKDCSEWKKEKAIQQVKTLNKVTFPEARKIVEASGSTRTFASVVTAGAINAGVKKVNMSCQTDLTWLHEDNPQSIPKVDAPQKQASSQTDGIVAATIKIIRNAQTVTEHPRAGRSVEIDEPRVHSDDQIVSGQSGRNMKNKFKYKRKEVKKKNEKPMLADSVPSKGGGADTEVFGRFGLSGFTGNLEDSDESSGMSVSSEK